MGFGVDLNVKVEAPKVDVAAAVSAGTTAVASVVGGAVAAATTAAGEVVAAVAAGAQAAAEAVASLAQVAGAIADVEVSFTGPTEDIPMDPHSMLIANASFEETQFEKGPVWIRIRIMPALVDQYPYAFRLYSLDGTYDVTRNLAEYAAQGPAHVDLLFEDAPMGQQSLYALDVVSATGAVQTVFSGVQYGDLRIENEL